MLRKVFVPIVRCLGLNIPDNLRLCDVEYERKFHFSLSKLKKNRKLKPGKISIDNQSFIVESTSTSKSVQNYCIVQNKKLKGFNISRQLPSLKEKITNELRDFSFEERIEMIAQLIQIVEVLESTKLIHGRISLNSIFLDDDSTPIRLKLGLPAKKVEYCAYFSSSQKIETQQNSVNDDQYSIMMIILFLLCQNTKCFYTIIHQDKSEYTVLSGKETLNLIVEFLQIEDRPDINTLFLHKFQGSLRKITFQSKLYLRNTC